ncbi:MAG: RNA polymerase sigma factor [Prolixibacteraceae bacterium]|nr:RNA polymerase sigma factor [Prolixibacteraceae bacterium]
MNKNDQDTFLALYEPVHDQFCRFCRAISGNQSDAEDLIQDSILNVIERLNKIQDKAAFKSYLFNVAGNLNKMRLRRSKFRAEFSVAELSRIVDFSQSPEQITDFRIVYEKMLNLPPRIAETLILYHITDLSIEEIHSIQGGSLSGVKMRLKRGREKLLSLLNTKAQKQLAVMLLTL